MNDRRHIYRFSILKSDFMWLPYYFRWNGQRHLLALWCLGYTALILGTLVALVGCIAIMVLLFGIPASLGLVVGSLLIPRLISVAQTPRPRWWQGDPDDGEAPDDDPGGSGLPAGPADAPPRLYLQSAKAAATSSHH